MGETKKISIGDTGYYVGKLSYFDKNSQEFPINEVYEPSQELLESKPKFTYDSETGNVHLFPDCIEKANRISKDITDKLIEIKEALKEKKQKEEINLVLKEYEIGSQFNSRIFNETPYQDAKKIFGYVYVNDIRRNISFQIMGIRFSKNENTIDCQLCSLQFAAIQKITASIDLYPEKTKKIKIQRTINNYYYNPPCSFWDETDKICNEFIKFIKECQ